MKITLSFFLLFLYGVLSTRSMVAQNPPADSLSAILKTAKNDTTRLGMLTNLMVEFSPTSPEYIAYNNQIGKILFRSFKTKIPDPQTRRSLLVFLGYWYNDKAVELSNLQEIKEVIEYCNSTIAVFDYLGMEDEKWGAVSNKASVLRKLGHYEEAISSLFEALKHHEATHNALGISMVNTQLGAIYEEQEEEIKAIASYKKALQWYEQIKDLSGMDLQEMAIVNFNIGMCYFNQHHYTDARIYIHKAIKIEKENDLLNSLSHSYSLLSDIDFKEEKYNEALANLDEAMLYAKSDRTKGNLWLSFANVYYNQKNYQQAEKYYNNALSMLNYERNYKMLQSPYLGLYKTYKATGGFEKSLDMLEKYHQAIDSTKIETSKNVMAQQQLKYEYEKKELSNKLEQEKKISAVKLENEQKNARKNILVYVLISVAVILVLTIVYLYKFFQQKTIISANKNNELKQKLLLTQMNPHFIFNSVDNIQSLIYNQQNTEAIKYLSKFSKLTRQILENSTENYITLTEEIAMTENYLVIQQLLYNNNFEYKVTVDESIDTDSILLPPMLTQPFIENAVKHGLKSKIGNGIINIRFSIDQSALVFEVTDNGLGFGTQEKKNDHRSMAMDITKKRLISYTKNDRFLVQSENVKNTEGVVVGAKILFEIPYIYEN